MRIKFIALLLLAFALQSLAQGPHRCDFPLPDYIFKQKQKSVAMQQSEDRKLQVAAAIAVNNCLSVEQVKILASLFIDDFNRLDFAIAAWQNTVDKENFYFVYDDFAYFSTVFMLHDYIKSMEGHPTDYIPPYEPPVTLSFPPFDYPVYENYRGPSNCNYPMREDEFMKAAIQVAGNNSEANKMLLLTQITQNACLSVAQAMKLASLLGSEPNRLSFFKTAYLSVFDLNNLPFGAQLFSHIPNKAAYNEFINRPAPGPGPVVPPPCAIDNDEFQRIKESIAKESFNSTKLTIAKQIIRSKQCFTSRQITDIVKLFSFDDTRLEVAKYAFEYTIDRENYYQVADAFTFSSSKEDLMKFLEGKR
jgi:hypothetical protein